MPKSQKSNLKKKQQQHHQPPTKTQDLSQSEIWDDSALIRSWDSAVKEYEYYHSIFARGEDVDLILQRAAEMEDDDGEEEEDVPVHETTHEEEDEEEMEDGEIDDFEESESKIIDSNITPIQVDPQIDHVGVESNHDNQGQTIYPDIDINQTLENVKMAYYWAGYYSGLYDGQLKQTGVTGTATTTTGIMVGKGTDRDDGNSQKDQG